MKKCKYCQSEIDKKAKICPNCRKRVKTSAFTWFITILLIVVFISSLTSGSDNEEKQDIDKYITLSEFNQIENGMSYEQVKEIIGSEGTVMSETNVGDAHSIIYYWYGKDEISNANFSFTNNELINKTQIGLK